MVANAAENEVRKKAKMFVRNLSIKLRTHVYILRDDNNNERIRALTNDVTASRKRRELSLLDVLPLSRVRRESPGQNKFVLIQS